MDWFKKHWKKFAGLACGAATVALIPVNPVASAALGVVCGAAFGSDADIGRVIAQQVRDVFSGKGKGGKPN